MKHTMHIHIAKSGSHLSNGKTSRTGHMWFSLHDGSNAAPICYGFAPAVLSQGNPYAQGAIYRDDNEHYLEKHYSRSVEITTEQYEKIKAFGDAPHSANFSTDYNGLFNSCIDFTWKALHVGGLAKGFQGDVWPTWNVNDVEAALSAQDKWMDNVLHGIFKPSIAQSISEIFTAMHRFVMMAVQLGRKGQSVPQNIIEDFSIEERNPSPFYQGVRKTPSFRAVMNSTL